MMYVKIDLGGISRRIISIVLFAFCVSNFFMGGVCLMKQSHTNLRESIKA